ARPAAGGSTSDDAPALRFARRDELEHPSFARAVALLRVGELGSAERELEASGLLADDASHDALWIAAAMLDRAGAHTKALELARRRLGEPLMTSMPEGRDRALWRIAYPRAFHPLIDAAAETEGVPSSFVRAIAREESSFRPDAVSVAHAYGLCQIIAPTAQRIARPLGLASDPRSLRRPEINVRIGAAYMGALRRRFDPQPALVPAAYNAGEGAVERWLRERGALELDEFIEEIPYDETRRYSRRVLQTWGIYGWLDDGALPRWPSALPSR
ncbi:MAG: lytic transglycosylase domain-containing protein, partial [Myxococcota bacterium]|nr:lytic transglycosylase domain-containing protein [Myxococcota bacterium]